MKKILILLLFFLMSCSKQAPNLIGKQFQSEIEGISVTLSFHPDGHFYGQMISSYFGKYSLDKHTINFVLQGNTMNFRTRSEIEKEEKYFKNLAQISSYELNERNLILSGKGIQYQWTELNSD